MPEERRASVARHSRGSLEAGAGAAEERAARRLRERREVQDRRREERRARRGAELPLPRNRYTAWAFGD